MVDSRSYIVGIQYDNFYLCVVDGEVCCGLVRSMCEPLSNNAFSSMEPKCSRQEGNGREHCAQPPRPALGVSPFSFSSIGSLVISRTHVPNGVVEGYGSRCLGAAPRRLGTPGSGVAEVPVKTEYFP